MPKSKILFVDDEDRIVRLLRRIFRREYEVFTASSGAEALEILAEQHINVLVSDQRMPTMTGIALLSEARKLSPGTVRVLLTGYADLVAIIGAVNEGEVFRFLNKPWNQDEIKAVVAEAAELSLSEKNAASENAVDEPAAAGQPLAKAAALLKLDGIASDRYEAMEMFTDDDNVMGASTVNEAMKIIEHHRVGVVVASITAAGENIVAMLAEVMRSMPSVTFVMLAGTANGDMVVKLINDARIYRFAMRPISPNVFRLAVSAAMEEHHRRMAPQHILIGCNSGGPETAEASEGGHLMDSIVTSLSRFTNIW